MTARQIRAPSACADSDHQRNQVGHGQDFHGPGRRWAAQRECFTAGSGSLDGTEEPDETTVIFSVKLQMFAKLPNALAYLILFLAQSVAVFFLFRLVFPIFYEVVTNLGREQDVKISTQLFAVFWAIVLHTCYWTRLRWVSVAAPFHNIFIGHMLIFLSRLNFLFGGAFFSAVFFRHLPELASFPPFGQALIKAALIGAVLFGLFCYSLELERLGKAIDQPPDDKLPT